MLAVQTHEEKMVQGAAMNDEVDMIMNSSSEREYNDGAMSYEWNQEGKVYQALLIGDCRKLLPKMRRTFDLIVADAPYRIASWKAFGSTKDKSYGIEPPTYDSWIPQCIRLLSETGSLFIFEDSENLFELGDFLRWSPEIYDPMNKTGLPCFAGSPVINPPLIWFKSFVKSHPTKGRLNKHYEPIFWVTKKDPKECYFDNKPLRGLGSHFGGDIMMASSVNRGIVPGQKPIKIIKRLIEVHTKPGGWILDPFGGSLTVLKACQELGRNCVTIEINKETAEKAIKYRKLE
jgi:DNA modification methylase